MNKYLHELKVLKAQLNYPNTYDSAIRGLMLLVGVPIIGILAIVNMLIK